MPSRSPWATGLASLGLVAACGASATVAPAVAPPPASARWPEDCPPIDGIGPLIAPGATLVLGELHGTQESPRFVGDAACHAAAAAPVTVALEIPRDEQTRIDAFVASPGAATDTRELLAGPFWLRDDQDGRSSEATLSLIRRVRAARAAGVDVTVLAFDIPADATGVERDREMANAIATARAAAPARTFVVLAGNYHSRRTPGAPWDAAARWMAGYLVERGVTLTTLDVEYAGGSAWVCMADTPDAPPVCGAHEWPSRTAGPAWVVRLAGDVEGHDGRYGVGTIQASPPAVR